MTDQTTDQANNPIAVMFTEGYELAGKITDFINAQGVSVAAAGIGLATAYAEACAEYHVDPTMAVRLVADMLNQCIESQKTSTVQ